MAPPTPRCLRARRASSLFSLSRGGEGLHQAQKDSLPDQNCYDLLQHFKSGQYKVIEPAFIASSRTDTRLQHVLDHCPQLPFDRVWYTTADGPIDPRTDETFRSLSIDQADAAADYYAEYTANLEFYDLSPFFSGAPIWASTSEGGLFHCKPTTQWCSGLQGYRRFTSAMSAVFDSASCKLFDIRNLNTPRLSVANDTPFVYSEKPDFSSYIQINQTIYLTQLKTSVVWTQFAKLLESPNIDLIVVKVTPDDPQYRCHFSAR